MSQTVDSATKIPLNVLLLGKTGHGKSATGNSILGQMGFKPSSQTKSEIKGFKFTKAEHSLYDIKVVDGPGLVNTDLSPKENIQTVCENMAEAVLLCNDGVHVFILVIKFGIRFTSEERKIFSDLKVMFGRNYLKEHGIIVVTGGDQFQFELKNQGTPNKRLKEWLQEQDEDLFKECPRIVLFNNVTDNEDEKENQRNELFQHAEKLCKEKGHYTHEQFSRYADLRAEMANNVPLSKESVERKIFLLKAELGRISQKSTLHDLEHLGTRVDFLLKQILVQDQNEKSLRQITDVLGTIKSIIQELERAVKEGNSTMIKVHVDNLQMQKKRLKERLEIPWNIVIAVTAGCLAISGNAMAGVVFVSGCLLVPSAFRVLRFVGRTLASMGSALMTFSAACIGRKLKEQLEKKQ